MFGMFSNWGPGTDQPHRNNVLVDDTVGGLAGLFDNVAEGSVASGVQWGAGGTEFTGTGDIGGEEDIFWGGRF